MTHASFKLDVFEGPLDLLLTLINTHKLNIYDIEITLLLNQYMEYINDMEYEDYDEASDFLEMAARLVYIKTCYLLPHDNEGEELKKELEGRLIEYSLCKAAAAKLKERFALGDIFVREPIKLPVNKTYTRVHDSTELYNAYMGISAKGRKLKPLRADVFQPIVSHKIVSVTSKIIYVLKKLYKSGEFDMAHLYDGMREKSEQVATFLAILELTKSGRIFLNDDNTKVFFNRAAKSRKTVSAFDEEQVADEPMQDDIEEEAFADESFTDEDTLLNKEENVTKEHNKVSRSERIAAPCVSRSVYFDDENAPQAEEDSFDEELKLLAGLSKEPLKDVYKPSYWNELLYFWGYSPVGDNSRGSYWRYGHIRK